MPDRGCPGERFRDIGEVGLDAHNLEGVGIHLVSLVAGIVAGQWGNGWANETHCQWLGDVNVVGVTESPIQTSRTVVVENLDLILMSMTKENASNGRWRKASDY